MKKQAYKDWLELQKYQPNTISAQMHRAGRVDELYGDLDAQFETDKLESVIEALKYSKDDERQKRPNNTKIPFNGDPFNNLASYRDAVKRYRKFRMDSTGDFNSAAQENHGLNTKVNDSDEESGRRFGLERDMQAALRNNINQLEEGLTIIDEGAERSVDSGFIDITARDANGTTVVIELKTGVAGRTAVGQILGYMGDILAEQDGGKVRGILVASEFDGKAKSATRIVPDLILRKYSVRFTFSDGKA
jgi:hypothetical protein